MDGAEVKPVVASVKLAALTLATDSLNTAWNWTACAFVGVVVGVRRLMEVTVGVVAELLYS